MGRREDCVPGTNGIHRRWCNIWDCWVVWIEKSLALPRNVIRFTIYSMNTIHLCIWCNAGRFIWMLKIDFFGRQNHAILVFRHSLARMDPPDPEPPLTPVPNKKTQRKRTGDKRRHIVSWVVVWDTKERYGWKVFTRDAKTHGGQVSCVSTNN